MSHYLVIGYPRTGTTSVVDLLMETNGHRNNFVQDLKYNGVDKWFASEKSVAKMHTHREFKLYGPHLQHIIDRTDEAFFTTLRKNLEEHLISYLCVYLCNVDSHASPVWQMDFDVKFPISNKLAYEQMGRLTTAMIGLKPKLETYRCLPWKKITDINVFDGFDIHVNKWINKLDTDFEDPDKIKEYAKYYAKVLKDEGIY